MTGPQFQVLPICAGGWSLDASAWRLPDDLKSLERKAIFVWKGLSDAGRVSHLARDRCHGLPGEGRLARACSADGCARVAPDHKTLRPHKRRDHNRRGRADSTLTVGQ